jgi:hypothetical protein
MLAPKRSIQGMCRGTLLPQCFWATGIAAVGVLVALRGVAAARPPHRAPPTEITPASSPQAAADDAGVASAWWLRNDLAEGALDPMWNEELGGISGMHLSSTGSGSEAPANGIAAGPIETGGAKVTRDDADGFGAARVASVHRKATEVLAARDSAGEAIQRIVRANSGRFRVCYEAGLRSNPNLEGRVVAKLVIDSSGNVVVASDGGSDLPDADVVSCVVRGFANLAFPPTAASGMQAVTVVYPFVFSRGAGERAGGGGVDAPDR